MEIIECAATALMRLLFDFGTAIWNTANRFRVELHNYHSFISLSVHERKIWNNRRMRHRR